MLYHFLVPLAKDHILFNVFRYLTFRSFMALITGLVISLVIGPPLIQKLRELQHGGETIREDTPERHRTKKGTPTMGGIVIIAAILSTTLLWANLGNRYVWVAMLATLAFGLLGVWDDLTKLRTRKGLSMRLKFGVQVVLTGALLQIVFWQPPAAWLPVLAIPFFKGWLINLGWLWIPFAMLVVIGASNAVNLTDGLDGLAVGPVIMAGGVFGVIAYLTGNFRAADYLKILNVKGAGELTVFCGALIGAAIGFLWFNCHPAEVFMGDAGSLALGASIGMLAVLTKAELLLPLIGGIYVVEAGSVILQVAAFKLTGRHLQDDRAGLHDVDAADERQQQLGLGEHGEHADGGAERQRARVAHEDLGRMTVEPEEADGRADERAAEHRQLARPAHVEDLQIVGRPEVAREVGDDAEGRARHHDGADGQPVEPVGEVHRVAGADDDQHREDEPDDAEVQEPALEERDRQHRLPIGGRLP